MIPFPALLGLLGGIALGLFMAFRKKGNKLDLLHYGAVCGLIGFTLGYFVMLVVPAPV